MKHPLVSILSCDLIYPIVMRVISMDTSTICEIFVHWWNKDVPDWNSQDHVCFIKGRIGVTVLIIILLYIQHTLTYQFFKNIRGMYKIVSSGNFIKAIFYVQHLTGIRCCDLLRAHVLETLIPDIYSILTFIIPTSIIPFILPIIISDPRQ